jgi:DNA-directed RNA polymerase subunit H (RpoH/RPB5)
MTSVSYLRQLKSITITMMERRGYDVSEEKVIHEYTDTFFENVFGSYWLENPKKYQRELIESKRTSIRSMMSSIYNHKTVEGERALVLFVDAGSSNHSISNSETAFFSQLMLLYECSTGILISNLPLSSQAEACLKGLKPADCGMKKPLKGEYFIQHFLDSDLEIDPTYFCWNETHTLMTPAEAQVLYEEKKTKPSYYPKVDVDDPTIKYLGGRLNQLVKINRTAIIPGTLSKNSIFYRVIYNSPKKK